MGRRSLLVLAAGLITALVATGCGDQCDEPTLAQCQSHDWLESPCGQKHREVMLTDPAATCNVLLAEAAAQATEGIEEEEVAIPDELGGGVGMARVVPNSESGLANVDLPLTYAGRKQQTAASATEGGLSAADLALRQQWDSSGIQVDSCEEYVYEKYYDYMQFADALAGRYTDNPSIVEAAFGVETEPTSIGTRGMAATPLQMKEGLDLPVQAPESGYVVDVAPDNDCYLEYSRIRVDNAFLGAPQEMYQDYPDLWQQVRDQRCYRVDIDSPQYTPLSADSRWQWHWTRLEQARNSGYALVELDAAYDKVKEFQGLLTSLRNLPQKFPLPVCCMEDMYGECCENYSSEYFTARTAITSRLQELLDWAIGEGCLESGATLCSWSPSHLVASLEDSFGAAMEADYQRCLKQTGDDFEALKNYRFVLPDVNHTVWPSQSECDTTYAATWPTCPYDDYTVSASAVDLFAQRTAEFDGPLEEYLLSTMPRELINAQGSVRLPGISEQASSGHFEAGNSQFGVFYGHGMGWSIPGIEAVASDDSAQLCMLGPEASAHFYLGGWAFGSERLYAIDTSYRASMDGNVYRSLSVLNQTIWQETLSGSLSDIDGFAASVQLVMPKFCRGNNPCGEGLTMRFSVAGIPMSVSGAVAGSLGVGTDFQAQQAASFTPGQEQECWSFAMSFGPSISLDVVASLNALDSGAITAGLRVALSLVKLSLPFSWTVSENNVLDPVDGEHLNVTVETGVDLMLELLAGSISAFVSVDVGLFDMSYSYKLFSWNGIRLAHPLAKVGYDVHLNRLLQVYN